ncbi:MAG: hypothetical protein M3N38_05630, partial [Pseudomonadota bacterium]|nr:hypothetical protein [Pseudomonadota bacterium]
MREREWLATECQSEYNGPNQPLEHFMPSQPAWTQPRNVALLIAGYLLVHMGVRLWMGPTLGLDDAEQALFAQQW